MSVQELNLLVKTLPDGQPATITLTDALGATVCLPCIYKESEAPSFFLLFPPGALPEKLDRSRQCPLACQDRNGKDVSIVAEIVAVNNRRSVELVARKSVRPEDIRDFFRVDIRTGIVVNSSTARDAIAKNCFTEQRRQLREKVKTL